jgi:hypothetical protein
MAWKLLLFNVVQGNNSDIYSAPDTGEVGYLYTSASLGEIVENLPQARYLKISNKYVAVTILVMRGILKKYGMLEELHMLL